MKIKHIIESMGGTTAGAIASVASPMGETQKRNKPEKAPKVTKGKKYANVISEGKMKDLAYDIQHLDAGNFMKKYGQPKEYFTKKLGNPPENKPVSEAELQEDDLILVPGQIRKKDKSFIPHDKNRRDHEVEMARKELYAAAKDAMRIFKQIKHRSEDEGLMAWQQSYITLASDYLNSVADSLADVPSTNEMTGGVLAGGMSNFEETLVKEGVIIGQSESGDPMDPQVAVLGGAGSYSLKGLYKKAQREAEQLTKDIEIGRFRGSAYNVKQLQNTLDTIVAAHNELEQIRKSGGAKSRGIERNIDAKEAAAEGGMSNFEEGRYYNPLDQERREQSAMDADRRRFKHDELSAELAGEEEAVRRANEGPWHIRINGKIVKDKNKNPYVFSSFQAAEKAVRTMRDKAWNQGKEFSYSRTPTDATKKLEEKKDACYSKVKSRYKVWPSAYASGALSKCRKVGASNWGNKSKK